MPIKKEYSEWEQKYNATISGNLDELRNVFNNKDETITFIDNLQTSMEQSVDEMHNVRKNASAVEDFTSIGNITTGVIGVSAAKILVVSTSLCKFL